MDCDIVLLPAAAVADEAIKASHLLAKQDGLFMLENGVRYPPISLYMATISVDDLNTAQERLRQITASTSALNLSAYRYDLSGGYFVVDYKVTEGSVALQQQVLANIGPLRQGIMAKDQQKAREATGQALHNYQTYGYKYVGDLFHPHITLTKFADDQRQVDATLLPPLSAFDGTFSVLGMYELGEHNTCIHKISEVSLSA